MSNSISNVIWIDANIKNEENQEYQKDFKKEFKKFFPYIKVKDGINKLKEIKFKETYLITSGSLYPEFISDFKKNLNDIYNIPKIIIFCATKENLIKNNMNLKETFEDPYFNNGGIQTLFSDVMNFLKKKNQKNLLNKKKETKQFKTNIENKSEEMQENEQLKVDFENLLEKRQENEQLTFEYINQKEKLYLPLYYKTLIKINKDDNFDKCTQDIYKKYSNDSTIDKLLSPIINLSKIPNELLCKYYLRLYTAESQFYRDINKNLREGKKEEFMDYIKVLYEGLKLNSLPSSFNETLYRGSLIKKTEIELIEEYLNQKKIDNLPRVIVFSNSFLSFSKKESIAKDFISYSKSNDLCPVFFILKKIIILIKVYLLMFIVKNFHIFLKKKKYFFFLFLLLKLKKFKKDILMIIQFKLNYFI